MTPSNAPGRKEHAMRNAKQEAAPEAMSPEELNRVKAAQLGGRLCLLEDIECLIEDGHTADYIAGYLAREKEACKEEMRVLDPDAEAIA